jgi:hypothetical protein
MKLRIKQIELNTESLGYTPNTFKIIIAVNQHGTRYAIPTFNLKNPEKFKIGDIIDTDRLND